MDRAGADLPLLPADGQRPSGVDQRREASVIAEHAVAAQDMGDEVVGEDRQPVEIVELGDAGKREVGGEDLGALEEAAVGVHRHPRGDGLGQPLGAAPAGRHQVERRSLAEEAAEPAQRLGVEGDQLVVGWLTEHVRELGRPDAPQLGVRVGTRRAEAVGQGPGDRRVAAASRPLAERREPAGPEVDRVEDQEVGGDVGRVALEVVARRVERRLRPGGDVGERGWIDRHGDGSTRQLCAVAADVIAEAHPTTIGADCASILRVMGETVQDERIEALLEGLNTPQREAVTHGDGPLLILAGAGSGKTRVLTHRIAYLVHSGAARADEMLAITFTNKAAQEMRERVELLLGRSTRAMWVMTFHAACCRILRAEAHRLGYTRQFTIYDQADSRRLVKRCLDELNVDPKRFAPAGVHNQISSAKNLLQTASDYRDIVGSLFEQTVADAYELYEAQLVRNNAMDFDDLLFRAVDLLRIFEEVRERYQTSFRHVLVDEYQDTNHAQYVWLTLLAGAGARGEEGSPTGHRNLAVVGDDSQSIYGFRGADIRNILDFQDDFPDTRVVKLEQNYRSTQTILSAANAVIANNRGAMRKALWTDLGEGDPHQGAGTRRRACRGPLRARRDRAPRRGGRQPVGGRDLLPDERAVAGARGHARARRRSRTR